MSESDRKESSKCALCHRYDVKLTFHHLIPKKMHSKNYIKKQHPCLDLNTYGVKLCIPCHKTIHQNISHKNLAQRFYTLELLLTNELVRNAVNFNSKQTKRKLPK